MLALVAPLLAAHAQAPGSTEGGLKVRILSVSTPPLAEEQLPEGGLVPALVNASLARAKAGAPPKAHVRWITGGFSQEVLSDSTVDVFLPVVSADCDHPNALTHSSAVLCDNAVYSDPVVQVVLGLFTLAKGGFKFDTDDSILGKTVCVWREDDVAVLNANGRNWAAFKRITVLKRPTLLDCVVAVQAYDADAFVAIDLEGTHLLRKLGLSPYIVMHPRPLATRGVHAVIWRENPNAAEILAALNSGLKELKESNAYAALVQHHLTAAEAPPPVVMASAAKEPAPTAPPVAAAPPSAPPPKAPLPDPSAKPDGAPKQAAPAPSVAKEAASPKRAVEDVQPPALKAPPKLALAPAPAPAAVPVLDQASRAVALKFLKRGEEELSEGRIAPARLLFERAAEMGLAQAAMALAGTYDATELAKPHLRHVPADVQQAKHWYERASVLGAAEAAARLQRLGSTAAK